MPKRFSLRPWSPRCLAITALLSGCSVSTDAPYDAKPAPQAAANTPGQAAPVPAAAAPAPEAGADEPAGPLTDEELALIAADPKDLTPEMRRKRAYARRKQIMQNPDSPTARALKDLAEAHQAGEVDIQPKGDGTWFHARGTTPTSGRPPAGWRPSDGEATPTPGDDAPAAPPQAGADAP